jgi:hypothetical protein
MKIIHWESGINEAKCPHCGSLATAFDDVYRFWECKTCCHVWAFDRDDPDYEEYDDGHILPKEFTPGFPYPEIKLGKRYDL